MLFKPSTLLVYLAAATSFVGVYAEPFAYNTGAQSLSRRADTNQTLVTSIVSQINDASVSFGKVSNDATVAKIVSDITAATSTDIGTSIEALLSDILKGIQDYTSGSITILNIVADVIYGVSNAVATATDAAGNEVLTNILKGVAGLTSGATDADGKAIVTDMINIIEDLINSKQVTAAMVTNLVSQLTNATSDSRSAVVSDAVSAISNAAATGTVTSIEALLADIIKGVAEVTTGSISILNIVADVIYGVAEAAATATKSDLIVSTILKGVGAIVSGSTDSAGKAIIDDIINLVTGLIEQKNSKRAYGARLARSIAVLERA